MEVHSYFRGFHLLGHGGEVIASTKVEKATRGFKRLYLLDLCAIWQSCSEMCFDQYVMGAGLEGILVLMQAVKAKRVKAMVTEELRLRTMFKVVFV